MPYIRDGLNREALLPQPDQRAWTPGELNYQFTCLAIQYAQNRGLDYQVINDIMGAFEGAKAEFYRRVAVPYEDEKIEWNGDVYPKDLLTEKDDA